MSQRYPSENGLPMTHISILKEETKYLFLVLVVQQKFPFSINYLHSRVTKFYNYFDLQKCIKNYNEMLMSKTYQTHYRKYSTTERITVKICFVA